MTTLIALASKHAVVMGADSLGTDLRRLVDPSRLFNFFDPDDDLKMKMGDDGQPLLKDYLQLFDESELVPYNQLHHVNKLFKLGNLPIGAAFTGTTSIGDSPIRGLVAEFNEQDPATKSKGRPNYTVNSVSNRLLGFLRVRYQAEYTESYMERDLELLVGGYDRNGSVPRVMRIDVRANKLESAFSSGGPYGVAFGGQMDWIQRIVFGTDVRNQIKMIARSGELLSRYRQRIKERLQFDGIDWEVPEPSAFGDELNLFHNWGLDRLRANWEDFSEQNAIDCVNFFLDIMIRSQDVSVQLPTVGGNIHIAVIRKDGFHPVTKEVWKQGEHEVPIPEVGR